jgi:hypothetical protein
MKVRTIGAATAGVVGILVAVVVSAAPPAKKAPAYTAPMPPEAPVISAVVIYIPG